LAAGLACGVLLVASSLAPAAHALRKAAKVTTPPPATSTNFNLQVTPSPLVTTLSPGQKTQVQLKIFNGGNGSENLQIDPRAFTISTDSSQQNLLNTPPTYIASWTSFSSPKFTIQSQQWFTETITFNTPKDAGFSYAFALVISRQSVPQLQGSGRILQGSVAIFTLANVDRPGATSDLEVSSFTSSKRVYDYLPATFDIHFRNNGNTIAQPLGNIFIQRSANSTGSIDTLNINDKGSYILPNTERTISATWSDGFPAYKTTTNADGSTSRKLVWNWANLSKLRIGRYTAHLVAVYNQGGRDIPIVGNVTFWVIPWKILLVPLIIILLLVFAAFIIIRSMVRGTKRKVSKRKGKKAAAEASDSENGPAEKTATKPQKKSQKLKKTAAKDDAAATPAAGDDADED